MQLPDAPLRPALPFCPLPLEHVHDPASPLGPLILSPGEPDTPGTPSRPYNT